MGVVKPVSAQSSAIDAASKADQSLVEIRTVYRKFVRGKDGQTDKTRMMSYERRAVGIVLDASGLIVTNTHTIVNAPVIFVVLRDGTRLSADLAYVSPVHDFSFLKIRPLRPLYPIAWADSSQIELGQEILGIGNSDDDYRTIMAGQVTNLMQSRTTGAIEFLKVNLQLYRGDSGGPILDRYGRLLGIVMAKERNHDGTVIAIASDTIRMQYLKHMRGL